MTTSDAMHPLVFRAIKGSSKHNARPVALAFSLDAPLGRRVETVRLFWTSLMAARLRELAAKAKETREPEGKSLPYASLRAALQVILPEAMLLSHDLGGPWAREDQRDPFLELAPAKAGSGTAPERRAVSALRTWIRTILRPWVERLKLPLELADAVDNAAGEAFRAEVVAKDLAASIREGEEFGRYKHALLQAIASRLEGTELFTGLGPVRRIVRRSGRSNEVEFQTWPIVAKTGGRYSMVATFSVETTPFSRGPVVTVRASRRRWLEEFPESARLRRQRMLTGHLMGQNGAPISISFDIALDKGQPIEPTGPEFMIEALLVSADLALPVTELVRRNDGRTFFGVAFQISRDRTHPVGGGASTLDNVELFDAAAALLAKDGFQPLKFDASVAVGRTPKRALDFHKAFEAEALIAHFALSIGANDLAGAQALQASRDLLEGVELPEMKEESAQKALAALAELREANQSRVARAFGEKRPTIVLFARRTEERRLMRAALTGMFGDSVAVAERQLPSEVHNHRAALPRAEAKSGERFKARLEAWAETADELKASFGECHALVQAAMFYDGRRDDVVNKLAGRHALVTRGVANVQYLRPPQGGARGVVQYLHRVQAAIYDLLFGHSGLVSDVKPLIEGDFPDAETRPRSILGVSLVSQASLKLGGQGGQVILATRIDVASGRTEAKLCWRDSRGARWTREWEPFFAAMRRVASLDVASIGEDRETRRDTYQSFVCALLDQEVERGDRPLVLFDSTSAAGCWSWLTDGGIGGTIRIGREEVDKTRGWASARLVRIRLGRAGRLLTRKTKLYERLDPETGEVAETFERNCPTASVQTAVISNEPGGRGSHYWISGGYLEQRPRGLSVFRALYTFVPLAKVRGVELPPALRAKGLLGQIAIDIEGEPYRVPNAIDVTVAALPPGDDPNRVAHTVSSLRFGYGHSRDGTALPAPLSFESKARDYMARFDAETADEHDPDAVANEDSDVADGIEASLEAAAAEAEAEPSPADQPAAEDMITASVEDEADPKAKPVEQAAEDGPGELATELPDELGVVAAASAPAAVRQDRTGGAAGVPGTQNLRLAWPWSSLCAGTMSARLRETSSLSGRTIEVPFGPGEAALTVGSWPGGRSEGWPARARQVPKNLRGETDGMRGVADMLNKPNGLVGSVWSNAPREPLIPIPSFITRDWLAQNFQMVRSHIGALHRWRQEIRDLSGFPWPCERPTVDQMPDLMLDGLKYPFFLRTMLRLVARDMSPQKRLGIKLFSPFENTLAKYRSSQSSSRGRGRPGATTSRYSVQAMIDAQQPQLARCYLYLVHMSSGMPPHQRELLEKHRKEFAELIEIVEALDLTFEGVDFDYARDINIQHAAPQHPPLVSGDDALGLWLPPEYVSSPNGAYAEPCQEPEATEAADDRDAPDCGEDVSAQGSGNGLDETGMEETQIAGPDAAEAEPEESIPPQEAAASAGHAGAVGAEVAPVPPADAAMPEQAWRVELTRLAAVAAEWAGREPAREALAAILGHARAAKASWRRWEASRPKLVDAALLVADARALLADIREIAASNGIAAAVEAEIPELPYMPWLAKSAADEARTIIAEAKGHRDTAEARLKIAAGLLAQIDMRRLDEVWALKTEGQTHLANGTAAAQRMLALVADNLVTPHAAPATPAAPPPASGADAPEAFQVPMGSSGSGEVVAPAQPEPTAQSAPTTLSLAPGPEALHAPEINGVHQSAPDLVAEEPVRAVVDGDDGLDVADHPGWEEAEAAGDAETVSGTEAEIPSAQAHAEAILSSEPERDPMMGQLRRRIIELVTAREFGLAYHLALAAQRMFPEETLGFTPAELRLAAMAFRLHHASMQGSPLLGQVFSSALSAVESLRAKEPKNEEVDCARRIIFAAASIKIALFHPSLPGVQGVQSISDANAGLGDGFHQLATHLVDVPRIGVTPSLLRNFAQEASGKPSSDDLAEAVLEETRKFNKLNFNFGLGNKIRLVMSKRDGKVGELAERIIRPAEALAAAREFVDACSSRQAITELLARVELTVNTKFKGLDGSALERMISNLSSIAARCSEFIEAAEAMPSTRNSGLAEQVKRIVSGLRSGVDAAEAALDCFRADSTPLLVSAAEFAGVALQRLRDALAGHPRANEPLDHLLATHGTLLWLPGLHYGHSWLPSPYQPEQIIQAILGCPLPPLPSGSGIDEAFETTVLDRLEEDSFVAARTLVAAGGFFGVSDARRDAMAARLAAELLTRSESLKDSLETTRRAVDRVQRMRGLVPMDQSQALFGLLDRIDPAALPVDTPIDARTEEEESELILDFCSAQQVLDEVEERTRGLLARPRNEMLDRIARLASEGRASASDAARVRGMIEENDLPTVLEWIGFLEDGRALPETTSANPRHHAFFPAVPRFLAETVRSKRSALQEATEALEQGIDLGPLAFSNVLPDRRDEAKAMLEDWRNLRRAVEGDRRDDYVITVLTSLLSKAGFQPNLTPDRPSTSGRRSMFQGAEGQLTVTPDLESVLLPDFGSLTAGQYRVRVLGKAPTEKDWAEICRDVEGRGILVFVTATIDPERRKQIAKSCVEHNRRALLIDEAIFLFALAEREFRPLTMFECAQPFSYATPYQDYGNAPVPREMFFGRRGAIRKIEERGGSCICYGGRRLGKTALLRHVKAEKHDPVGSGMAVGYAYIRNIGQSELPTAIWAQASRELDAVFKAPVQTYAEFAKGVRDWLSADPRRRILLLLDEADQFIEKDAAAKFKEFLALQELMDSLDRRFKFVLAGLHNVTRLARTENSPLKHIAAEPLRIGPLMEDDLDEAEQLIRRPLAAMGYEFEHHEDVWRILSHCNYYPVLVQTFCSKLLEELNKETSRKSVRVTTITGDRVRKALEDESIRREIAEKFDMTCNIDPRYELVARVIAERALHDAAEGNMDEGMSAVAVADQVAGWWPAAFDKSNRLSMVEDLLDELVGMGLLRETAGNKWAIRSHAILRLLGDEEKIGARLLEFLERAAPVAYDPRSMRRGLNLPSQSRVSADHHCPLTLGQEADIFKDGKALSLVFGSAMSDVNVVSQALGSADLAGPSGVRADVMPKAFASLKDLTDVIRQHRGERTLFVVADLRTQWDADWVEQLLRLRQLKEGKVRVVLVGGPEHAMRWVSNTRFLVPPPTLAVTWLTPWSEALVDHELGHANLPSERFKDDVLRRTGGFNRPMAQVFRAPPNSPERFDARVAGVVEKTVKSPTLLQDLGGAPVEEALRRMEAWADADGRIRFDEIEDGVMPEAPSVTLKAGQFVEYATLMGLLAPLPLAQGDTERRRAYRISPLLRAALASLRSAEAA